MTGTPEPADAARATPYDRAFYDDQVSGSERSAQVVLPLLYAIFQPRRVIDVGCGQGAWLAAAAALGSTTLTGVDGAWVDRARLRHASIDFQPVDLAAGEVIPEMARHDLCISVEVAEHLPPERAAGFVASLCHAADVVLFSAAVPFQGGTAHVNERRASYWADLFAQRGYDCIDLVRGAVWDDARVEWWYRQNALVFVARGGEAAARFRAAALPARPMDLVHPEAFEDKMAYLLPSQSNSRSGATMNRTVRAVLGVIVGMVVGSGLIWIIESIGHKWYPPPANLDMRDMAAFREYAAGLPLGALLYVVAGWLAGTYIGVIVAGSIARGNTKAVATVVAVLFVLACVVNLYMTQGPLWMWLAAIVGVPLVAWMAAGTTERGLALGAQKAAERTS